jgi:hypothetical protein
VRDGKKEHFAKQEVKNCRSALQTSQSGKLYKHHLGKHFSTASTIPSKLRKEHSLSQQQNALDGNKRAAHRAHSFGNV